MPTTFIPPNYPKSFIVFVIAVLTGLVSGGILILRAWLESALLETIGRLAFFACSAVAAAMFAVFLPGSWTGKYRDLPSRPWKEHVW